MFTVIAGYRDNVDVNHDKEGKKMMMVVPILIMMIMMMVPVIMMAVTIKLIGV